MPAVRCANANAFAGCNIGVPCSPLEAVTSLDPKDYVWGAPSPQQQQLLFQQFLQMHFLRHLHMSQHNLALAGASMSMPLHPAHPPAGPLAMPQHFAMIPGLSTMPGFLAGPHPALPMSMAPPPASLPVQPAPSQAVYKAKGAVSQSVPAQSSSQAQVVAKPVVKKEEQAVSSKASTSATPKLAPVPAVKILDPESPATASPTSVVNSADSVLSYLDKDDLFDCVGDFNMDIFDAMLSEHCDNDPQSSVKDQASTLCGAASVPSPSSSNGSIATIAGAVDTAVGTPTSNEDLSLLQAGVNLLPLPDDGGMPAFDFTADFQDVADFEFTDLDQMVGLTDADLACDVPAIDTLPAPGNVSKAQASRPLKVKKGSGVQKPTSRRCVVKNVGSH